MSELPSSSDVAGSACTDHCNLEEADTACLNLHSLVAAQSVARVLKAALLPAGLVVYHGPRDEVLPFFESCGFKIPGRKAVPDFLQEVWHQCCVQHFGCLLPQQLEVQSSATAQSI